MITYKMHVGRPDGFTDSSCKTAGIVFGLCCEHANRNGVSPHLHPWLGPGKLHEECSNYVCAIRKLTSVIIDPSSSVSHQVLFYSFSWSFSIFQMPAIHDLIKAQLPTWNGFSIVAAVPSSQRLIVLYRLQLDHYVYHTWCSSILFRFN